MEFDRFFKFSQLLLRDEFVLSYSGYVSEDILLAVGDTLRERLEDHARDGRQIRNVFSIFVELMQNIIRYGVEGPQPGPDEGEKPSFGIVMVAENDGGMDVIAGNFVTGDEAAQLIERVDMLQSKLDAAGIGDRVTEIAVGLGKLAFLLLDVADIAADPAIALEIALLVNDGNAADADMDRF